MAILIRSHSFLSAPARSRHRVRGLWVCLFVLLWLVALWIAGSLVCRAEEPVASEDQVKAAFLVNFPKYVEWPRETFATTNSPIVIAVAGESKLVGELQKVIVGRTVNGRGLVLKRLAAGEEAGACHILFISTAEQQRSPGLFAKLQDTNILTVGESEDFLARGGIINLARRDQKVALEVNLTAAGQAGIKISSKLLNVASVVKGKAQ